MIRQNRRNRLDRLIAQAFQGRGGTLPPGDFAQRVMLDIRNRTAAKEQQYFIRHVCWPMLASSALVTVLLLLATALDVWNQEAMNPYDFFNLDVMYSDASWLAGNGR